MSGLFSAFAFLGFGAGLVAMLLVIVMRQNPNGQLAQAGLVAMLLGFVGLIGLIATSLAS
ncbi:hypothetical protein [Paracoccus lutimaris]|uniref:Uncharacterized protein n=1 Tax=Paracoccus lutimaris TaxID=1490030 RepID=A0A368YXY3_9RHOB|nr:hypothetical protein [Paracoccus lutimaris]RCW85051.1 hypothetical protein DFP89_10669 [Paracoccus lutimaris]